jgi:hypothetical protein
MTVVDEWVALAVANRTRFLRYMFIQQALVGAFLLIVAYYMGHGHFQLIREGVRTPGRVVGHKHKNFSSSTGVTTSFTMAFMPIVEFRSGERVVRKAAIRSSSARGGSLI